MLLVLALAADRFSVVFPNLRRRHARVEASLNARGAKPGKRLYLRWVEFYSKKSG